MGYFVYSNAQIYIHNPKEKTRTEVRNTSSKNETKIDLVPVQLTSDPHPPPPTSPPAPQPTPQ